MAKSLLVLVLTTLIILSGASASIAGYKYHNRAYRNYHYRAPAFHYNNFRNFHYRTPAYYHYNYRNYYPYADRYWTSLGVGFVTGAAFGSLLYAPYRQQTVIYSSPPPVVVYREPVTVYRQMQTPPVNQPEQVLRQVETTAQLLNVRSGPGTGTTITDQVQRGTRLDVIGVAPGWLYIRTMAGLYGWVMALYTRDINGPMG